MTCQNCARLQQENAALKEELARLEQENKDLKRRLAIYENPNTPPSRRIIYPKPQRLPGAPRYPGRPEDTRASSDPDPNPT